MNDEQLRAWAVNALAADPDGKSHILAVARSVIVSLDEKREWQWFKQAVVRSTKEQLEATGLAPVLFGAPGSLREKVICVLDAKAIRNAQDGEILMSRVSDPTDWSFADSDGLVASIASWTSPKTDEPVAVAAPKTEGDALLAFFKGK